MVRTGTPDRRDRVFVPHGPADRGPGLQRGCRRLSLEDLEDAGLRRALTKAVQSPSYAGQRDSPRPVRTEWVARVQDAVERAEGEPTCTKPMSSPTSSSSTTPLF